MHGIRRKVWHVKERPISVNALGISRDGRTERFHCLVDSLVVRLDKVQTLHPLARGLGLVHCGTLLLRRRIPLIIQLLLCRVQ